MRLNNDQAHVDGIGGAGDVLGGIDRQRGAVIKINDAGFVEVRNQTYGRIVIRVEQI